MPIKKPKKAPKTAAMAIFQDQLVKDWLNNATSKYTRISRQDDLADFCIFHRIDTIDAFKQIKRSDIMEWRDRMAGTAKNPGFAIRSIKRKMSTVSKFFEYLSDEGINKLNPAAGVQRPKLIANEGATPIISRDQARDLLEAPDPSTFKGKRDRAILTTFLFHALRRSELCRLQIKSIQEREGIKQFMVHGKGDKIRYIPVNATAARWIFLYLEALGDQEPEVPLFQSVSNNGKNSGRPMTPDGIFKLIFEYGKKVGIEKSFSPHSLRATAATNARRKGVGLKELQEFLGHANISTTVLYDRSESLPENSPSLQIKY